MDSIKLSIIVPLYNSSSFISNCVQSLCLNLEEEQSEMIIVDDGSTDNSFEVAKLLAEQKENVYVIHQENQGLSGARNTGIENARGEYVWCVDADDEVTNQAREIVKILRVYKDLDFLAIQLQKVNSQRNPISIDCAQELLPKDFLMSGRDAIIQGYNPSSACALIMRREFLNTNNLRFRIGITHEDVEFTYRAMSKAQKVIFTSITPYLYFRRGDTMSTPKDLDRQLKYIIDDVAVADSFRSLSAEFKQSDPQLYKTILLRSQSIVFGLTFQLYRNRKQWGPKGINKMVLKALKEAHFYPLHGPYYSWKQHFMGIWLNIVLKYQ